MLNAWESHGLNAAQEMYEKKYHGPPATEGKPPPFQRKLRGCIAYVGQIRGRDDAIFLKLLSKYQRLTGKAVATTPPSMRDNTTRRDVFICHASEDKRAVVEPLVKALTTAQISVWFDKSEIAWGDSITGKINEGLSSSRYVIVVISTTFLGKAWAKKELDSAMSREIATGRTSVLPLMVGTDEEITAIQEQLPLQADKHHLRWSTPEALVEKVRELLTRSG
jgi:hypothetical protein